MKKSLLSVAFLLIFSAGIFALETDNMIVQLQFFTQAYRLNESIPVQISVVNTSGESFDFEVSPQIHETFFFEVRTPLSEEVEVTDDFGILQRQYASSAEDYREIVLQDNESFSHQIDLSEWFDFTEAGYYYVKGIFYPNPDDDETTVESIYYKILVKTPTAVEEALTAAEQEEADELDAASDLAPYDVIEDMLEAKMEKNWDRFLLHIDTEKLIYSFQNFSDEYDNARTGAMQLQVLEEFETYLTEYWDDTILSFQVQEATITSDGEQYSAEVTCEVEYQVRSLSYIMEYTFELYETQDGQWLVTDYTAHRLD